MSGEGSAGEKGAAGQERAALRLTGVTKRFGATVALEGVDLEVGGDELVVVLGPTGTGKTTLLRTAAGLERPDAGRVELHGQDVTDWPPARRDVAFVFQGFALYPGWSVGRNLAFPLRAPGRGLTDQEVAERVRWAAGLLHVEHLLDRPAERLSGGEMQRVAIGRAIVRRPRLFLFDEPLTNLDAKLREELRAELVVLRRQLGIPMLYVTHDQAEALSMGDRLAVLGGGRLLQEGTPAQVYRHPATPGVARQLGQPAINLIPVRRRGDAWVTEGAEGVAVVPVDSGQAQDLPEASRAWLGVRPEWVLPEGGPLPARVKLVEDTGPASILVVEWAGQTLHILTGRERAWQPGEVVAPRFDPGRVCLWPRRS